MLVSIVVPVYNEEENIAIFYNAVTKVMTGLPYEYELIYVDDGSTDCVCCRFARDCKT